ncbi:hypothetical protein [Parerythrobacter lacustris]|uniref:DUF883 domain-containing protein n=1 Tax=Parerythrobacter lacustris TaxID=2969984 RepID=A0ABT1XQI5_9SPHN|nr:hypothetical protein [Parerythrobacter lacustris]MCR2833935.1 hypothetical protein [Parerythrobacter lacustris]
MAEATTSKSKTAKKTAVKPASPPANGSAEAKTRFNAALEEAKAGAAALKTEAADRAMAYRDQAKGKSQDWAADAKTKAGELAVEGKTKASDAIASLGKVVADNAVTIDERFGEKYGDYARKASRGLQETSAKLDAKGIDELGEDAREFVRKSPGTAIGIAAVAGFLLARLFGGRRG